MAISFVDYSECEWKSFRLSIEGVDVIKIRGFKYMIESDDEELFCQGDEAVSIQSGNIKKSGSVKVTKSVIDALQTAAIAAGARWPTDIKFTLTATYLPSGTREMRTDVLGGVKISKIEKGWDQGAKYMELELPFAFLTLTTA